MIIAQSVAPQSRFWPFLTRIWSTFAGSGAESLVHCRVSVWKWLISPFEIAILCYFIIGKWWSTNGCSDFLPDFQVLTHICTDWFFREHPWKPWESQSQVFAFMSFAMEAGARHASIKPAVGSCPGLCIDSKKRQLAGESSCPRYVTHSRPPRKNCFFWYFSLESELRSLGFVLLLKVQSTLYFYHFLHGAALQSCVIIVQHGLSMVKVYSSHAH